MCIGKTGSGKSMIPRGVISLNRKYGVQLVPLQSIGVDQASSAMSSFDRHGVVVVHLDSLARDTVSYATFKDLLQKVGPNHRPSLLIVLSFELLTKDDQLRNIFIDHGRQQILSFVCYDEIHALVTEASYRQCFDDAITSFVKKVPGTVPVIGMSGTFNNKIESSVCRKIGYNFNRHVGTDTKRRTIFIDVHIKCQANSTLKCLINDKLSTNVTNPVTGKPYKVLIYVNSKEEANSLCDLIAETLDEVDRKNANTSGYLKSDVFVYTKATQHSARLYIIDLFNGVAQPTDEANLKVLVATSAASAGISSPDCLSIYRYGPARNMIDAIQELGRTGRSERFDGSVDEYNLIVNLQNFAALVLQIKTSDGSSIEQEEDLVAVLKIFAVPDGCIHVKIEKWQCNTNVAIPFDDTPCGSRCSYCRSKNDGHFTKSVNRQKITELFNDVFQEGPVSLATVTKAFSERQNVVWNGIRKDARPTLTQDILLRMIALNMLTYSIKQNTGTNTKVTVKDNFLLRWSLEGGIPVHQRDALWDLLKY